MARIYTPVFLCLIFSTLGLPPSPPADIRDLIYSGIRLFEMD